MRGTTTGDPSGASTCCRRTSRIGSSRRSPAHARTSRRCPTRSRSRSRSSSRCSTPPGCAWSEPTGTRRTTSSGPSRPARPCPSTSSPETATSSSWSTTPTTCAILYIARGVSKHERMTDEVVVEKYSVLPSQYADFATLRGDASDGLPGVAGIGDKTAASLLLKFGDLQGIVAAAEDPASEMSPGPRRRILDAAEYLLVAPKVVAVARDIDLAAYDATLPAEAARRRTPRRARRALQPRLPREAADERSWPAEAISAASRPPRSARRTGSPS